MNKLGRYKSIKFDMHDERAARAYKKVYDISKNNNISIRKLLYSMIEAVEEVSIDIKFDINAATLNECLANKDIYPSSNSIEVNKNMKIELKELEQTEEDRSIERFWKE